MNPESSPFRPGQPVPVESFVGRTGEIERVHGMVNAAVQGSFRIGFISGERGIGKSSLASFVRHLSEHKNSVAGCHVFLGGVSDLKEMVRRTFDRLLKESIDRPWYEPVREFFGNRVREVGLFGVTLTLNLDDRDLSTIAGDFVPSIKRLLNSIKEKREALLLILDDINGLASSDEFADWLKSMVDEIATSRSPMPLCVLVVGLEQRRQELVARQPSLARVFELIDIAPWSDEDVTRFYRRSFSSAGAKIGNGALKIMADYTGGLPVLAHEIGDAVWRAARAPEINEADIGYGIMMASSIVGRKFLEPQVFGAIQSDRYRSILRKIADNVLIHELSFRRSDLTALLTVEERRVLDSFLRRMKELGALEMDPDVRGGYRFPNRLHALYFLMAKQS